MGKLITLLAGLLLLPWPVGAEIWWEEVHSSYRTVCKDKQCWDEPIAESEPLPQYSRKGALKIDRASFEALLKDYPEAKLRVMLIDEPCRDKLEAAMRAMEPYIPRQGPLNSILRPNLFGMTTEPIHLWTAAQACWREP